MNNTNNNNNYTVHRPIRSFIAFVVGGPICKHNVYNLQKNSKLTNQHAWKH